MFRLFRVAVMAIGYLTALSVSVLAQSAGGDGDVVVNLRPKTVQRGQSALLEITAPVDRPIPLPEAPRGVSLRAAGESMTTQIINGRRSARIGRNYRIVADETGHYEISVGSKKVPLDVVDRAPVSSQPAAQVDDQGGVLLVVKPERSTAYVGQRVPVRIDLLVPEGRRLRLESLPAVSGSAFTLEDPGNKPDQDQVLAGDQQYTRFTWNSAVVPLKAGSQPLDVAMKMEVSMPERRGSSQGPGSPFDDVDADSLIASAGFRSLFDDDPFFAGMFGSFVQKEVTVVPRPAVVLDVKELPADRPAGHAGAVGHWQMTTSVDRRTATEGDPLTLRIEITGDGDLGRLAAPDFPSSETWKPYRPKVVETSVLQGHEPGRRVFELPVVARKSGDLEIPALSMSSLDPESGRFLTIASSPIPVHIDPAPPGCHVDRSDPEAKTDGDARPATDLREVRGSEVPVGKVSMPWAMIGMAALALLLVPFGFILAWLRRSGRSGARQAKSALRRSLKDADQAMRERDTDAFLAASAAGVAQMLGRDRREIITPADLDRVGLAADPDLHHVCSLVNDIPFSGRRLNPEEMERCLSSLRVAASKERV